MKKVLAVILLLLCMGTAAISEIYVNTVADPTYVRTEPKIAKNIVKELKPNQSYEWGGHIVLTNGESPFTICFTRITNTAGFPACMPACGTVSKEWRMI